MPLRCVDTCGLSEHAGDARMTIQEGFENAKNIVHEEGEVTRGAVEVRQVYGRPRRLLSVSIDPPN